MIDFVRLQTLGWVLCGMAAWLLLPQGTLAEQVPAQWIWSAQPAKHVQFSKQFELVQRPTRVRLRGVADYCALTVELSDRKVAYLPNYGPMLDVEIADAVRGGKQVIEVTARGSEGPSAFALWLDITFPDGEQQRIVTDHSWTCEVQSKGSGQIKALGQIAKYPFGFTEREVTISPFDDYTQWKQAKSSGATSTPASFLIPPNFEIDLLRVAKPTEDSWVSMAIDPRGRIVIGKEKQGLLRLTLAEESQKILVEEINDTLRECRGLLFAHDSLYANANVDHTLYRLRDTNGDDTYDQVEMLGQTEGGNGHGRNDLTLGPNGNLYLIHGDAVQFPEHASFRTPSTRSLGSHDAARNGYVAKFDPEGKSWEIVTRGLRNSYGIAFNTEGDMFTYDADAEFDMGSPWYRPTRVNHLLPGGDFAWRSVTKQWPPYYPDHPDMPQPMLDIGRGSPTSVKFGTKSNFPLHYQKALFILDWSYGRIIAVHLAPRGSSYACRGETFLKGRPLNVTDLDFGPDGAMYFITGGRQTQSALYRVRYVGPKIESPIQTQQQVARENQAEKARALRKRLESYHQESSEALDIAWPHLNHPDPWIRHAARIAVEHQSVKSWRTRALRESRSVAALTALMALARSGEVSDLPVIAERLTELDLEQLPPAYQNIALYTYQLCLSAREEFSDPLIETIRQQLSDLYPDSSVTVNRRLGTLLVQLGAPNFVDNTLALASTAERQEDQMHFLYVLRTVEAGWTERTRKEYFQALASMDRYLGGQGMPGFINQIREDALATLTESERQQYEPILSSENIEEEQAVPQRPLVKEWKPQDIPRILKQQDYQPNLQRGRAMYAAAQCNRCHRLGRVGRSVGPDLTTAAGRFNRRDLLTAVLDPSQVVPVSYRAATITTVDGKVITGQVSISGDFRSPVLQVIRDPLRPTEVIEIPKQEIEDHQPSPISPMPTGLLNTLSQKEILDLLAYIEARGQLEP